MKVDIRTNIKAVSRDLTRIQKKAIPLATAKALTFTAERAQTSLKRTTIQVFNNPPKTTRDIFRKQPARVGDWKKGTMHSAVYVKDIYPIDWITHHIEGGRRQRKASERRLKLTGGTGWTAIGSKARRNKHGNIARHEYAKMIADIRGIAGFTGDMGRTKTKREGGKKTIRYFMQWNPKTGKRIIYRKYARRIVPVLVETREPRYRKRLPFYRIVRSTIRRQFDGLLAKQLRRELAKGVK